ncbi:hypothetical protein ACPXCG_18640 [Gordonia sp. DT218]|uniref:hypothetical protein n=1 Tax=unclassified Gordonia (in: high G+C Gram-positive bacteria) TaxID=2657482 RepID=UPI003CEF4AF6
MNTASAVVVAVTFIWLGMVLAISFLEAPLKFRAPGVTLPIGLGIGRLVFRALNTAETLWSVVIVVALIAGTFSGSTITVTAGVAMAMLAIQLIAVRPRLTRRSDAVLAGHEGPRSHAHLVYVVLEIIKVVALVWLGVALLSAPA